ncbi:MAG TPA: hypothetical protein VMM15_32565 [Bradyrhizobium sp.]|nr:hypothetical protein [Bradyrhizobium sp.]
MNKLKIPHDAFVLVGDGRKALFLRNEGDEKFPNLKAERLARRLASHRGAQVRQKGRDGDGAGARSQAGNFR